MADNVAYTPGSGATIAADEIGGVLHQRVKISLGADNSAADAPGDGTDGMLVNLGANNDVTVTGTVTANLAAGTNNIGDVDVLTLPSVTIGTMAALVAGTANIGDVDVLTVPAPLSTTGGGTEATALRVTVASDSTGVLSVDDNGGSLTVDGAVTVAGDVAHDAADSGNPVGIGVQARTTNPTAVADGDRVRLVADKLGRLVVAPHSPRELVTQATLTLSSGTETTLLAAGGAGVFHDITMLIVSNTSNLAVRVDFRDTTAGAVVFSLFVAANGGGAVMTPTVPIDQTTANTNWTAQLSSATTDVRIFVQAIKQV